MNEDDLDTSPILEQNAPPAETHPRSLLPALDIENPTAEEELTTPDLDEPPVSTKKDKQRNKNLKLKKTVNDDSRTEEGLPCASQKTTPLNPTCPGRSEEKLAPVGKGDRVQTSLSLVVADQIKMMIKERIQPKAGSSKGSKAVKPKTAYTPPQAHCGGSHAVSESQSYGCTSSAKRDVSPNTAGDVQNLSNGKDGKGTKDTEKATDTTGHIKGSKDRKDPKGRKDRVKPKEGKVTKATKYLEKKNLPMQPINTDLSIEKEDMEYTKEPAKYKGYKDKKDTKYSNESKGTDHKVDHKEAHSNSVQSSGIKLNCRRARRVGLSRSSHGHRSKVGDKEQTPQPLQGVNFEANTGTASPGARSATYSISCPVFYSKSPTSEPKGPLESNKDKTTRIKKPHHKQLIPEKQEEKRRERDRGDGSLPFNKKQLENWSNLQRNPSLARLPDRRRGEKLECATWGSPSGDLASVDQLLKITSGGDNLFERIRNIGPGEMLRDIEESTVATIPEEPLISEMGRTTSPTNSERCNNRQ